MTDEVMILPVIPISGFVMFPGVSLSFELSRERSVRAAENAMKNSQKIFIVTQKTTLDEKVNEEKVYKIGIIAEVKHIISQQNSSVVRVMVEGLERAKIVNYFDEDSFISASVEVCESLPYKENKTTSALGRKAKDLFEEYLRFLSKVPPDLLVKVKDLADIGEIADYICSNLVVEIDKKQRMLEEFDPKKRIKHILEILVSEIDIMKTEEKIAVKLKNSIDKSQQDYILREQMKIISQELGEEDSNKAVALEYKEQLAKLKLKKEDFQKLCKECDRLAKIPVGTSESNISRTYIETCLELPWLKRTNDKIDLVKSREILDSNHFGLDDVKDKIIEILATRKLSNSRKGQIICLEGPPGIGKTSIAKSISETMGRKYQRISLGGIKDESEIRGHRRTYIGAMLGRIISAVKQSGVKNPVILLDEIDKMSVGYNGDPASALLEALDPEQNKEFYDHYIDLPFDLSEVLFITTANDKSQIPRPLYDRMEVITLYSYTYEEKFNIAKKHLIPKLFKKNGLDENRFSIEDEAIRMVIRKYVKEAGVRGLEKTLSTLMRKAAVDIVSGKTKSVFVDCKRLRDMLGPEKYKIHTKSEKSEVGVVKGLAWTSVGGETMPIEVALMKGKGKLQVTGSLGDVMKESAQLAVSYIRSNASQLGIKDNFYESMDIHIHAPEGAVPKDGPSAGVTMTTALVSALSGIPVKQDVAMTGEITLKGKVLAIGGLKEKTMAAYCDGVKTVIIPSENKSDLEKIDKKVKKSLKFIMADNLLDVFKNSLDFNNKDAGIIGIDVNKKGEILSSVVS